MYDCEISKVSPNLSLRLSPERKYQPKIISCETSFCDPCNCSPVKCLTTRCYSPCCSPCRPCSPVPLCPKKCTSPIRTYCSPNIVTCSYITSCNSPLRSNYIAYEECQFNDFLRKLMRYESQIESVKINLALNPDFNCEDAFRIFELNGRGFLDGCDLKCGLNLIGVFPTDQEIRLLMNRFDLLKGGCINYSDFFDMVVPFEKEYRNIIENRCPNPCALPRCPDVFCYSTICCLRDLFNLIINAENDINNNRKLFGTLRLKLRDIFGLLDCLRRGYITNSDLVVYLRSRGLFCTNKDADLLFIRLDKGRNGKVSFRDVEDEVQTLY